MCSGGTYTLDWAKLREADKSAKDIHIATHGIDREKVKRLFDEFTASLTAMPAYMHIVVREGDEPGSIVIENFPQP
jgi:hypothetical protein